MRKYLLPMVAAVVLAMATGAEVGVALVEPSPPFPATVLDHSTFVRSAPSTRSAVEEVFFRGDDIYVVDVVRGESPDGGSGLWYELASGGFVYSRYAAPRVAGYGHWFDVDLTEMTATAMVGWEPVYTARVVAGRPGWDTPVGTFNILRRVPNETMDGATLGIPPWSANYYYFPGVLYTQYFTETGAALHYNYWEPEDHFGQRRSTRGCVGLKLDDAAYFWDFAELGTVVRIHY